MYCIDAIRRIVTKSLYRTALPFSILSDISQISFEVLNIIPPLSCRLVSEVFRILGSEILGFPLSLEVDTNPATFLDPDTQFANLSSCLTKL